MNIPKSLADFYREHETTKAREARKEARSNPDAPPPSDAAPLPWEDPSKPLNKPYSKHRKKDLERDTPRGSIQPGYTIPGTLWTPLTTPHKLTKPGQKYPKRYIDARCEGCSRTFARRRLSEIIRGHSSSCRACSLRGNSNAKGRKNPTK